MLSERREGAQKRPRGMACGRCYHFPASGLPPCGLRPPRRAGRARRLTPGTVRDPHRPFPPFPSTLTAHRRAGACPSPHGQTPHRETSAPWDWPDPVPLTAPRPKPPRSRAPLPTTCVAEEPAHVGTVTGSQTSASSHRGRRGRRLPATQPARPTCPGKAARAALWSPLG